jgi:predicted nucleotidyltransferase
VLFATISGAHLYGFPSADSDFDLRGVHVLPLSQVVGLESGLETIEKTEIVDGLEIDLVTHDARKFFTLMLKKNGYVMEQLLSPLIVQTTPEHEELKAIAVQCLTRHHVHHYLGFAATQWQLCQKHTPCRVKPLLYVYRVLLTGLHLMQTGIVEANLKHLQDIYQLSYIPELIDQKVCGAEKAELQDIDSAFHENEYQRLRQELQEASLRSHLPEQPRGAAALHDLLIRIRLQEITHT